MRDERCGRASVLAQSCTHEEAEVVWAKTLTCVHFSWVLALEGDVNLFLQINLPSEIKRSRDHTVPYWFHVLKMPTVQSYFLPAAFVLKVAAFFASSKC